jgi:neuroblastoma-amplified sequence
LTKDRLSLVSQVLASSNDAYKHSEVILDLVYKLGYRGDIVGELKTFAMLTDSALQNEDFARAYETCTQMIEKLIQMRADHPQDDVKFKTATEVCWITCFQLGRQPDFGDAPKKLSLLGRALEFCPADKLHDVLTAWHHLEEEDIKGRGTSLSAIRDHKRKRKDPSLDAAASLRARLQDFKMPSPIMLSSPDAAALASKTLKSVAANLPFGRGRGPQQSGRPHGDVSSQAGRVLSKGIGWLIGADANE